MAYGHKDSCNHPGSPCNCDDVVVEVLMHKRTAKLVEYVPNAWIGGIIFYGMAVSNEPINDDTPIIFNDDKRYKLHEYENLGAL